MKSYLIQLIAAYFVGVACSISVEAPRRMIFRIAVIDTIGWGAYLLAQDWAKLSAVYSTYLAGVVIAALSHWCARRYREPVTVFFIPGFFTLVPGGGMYRTALYAFQGNMHLAMSELVTTIFTALAIALAVFTVDTIVKILTGQRFSKFVRLNPADLARLADSYSRSKDS